MSTSKGSAIGWLAPADNAVHQLPPAITHAAFRASPVTIHLCGEVDEGDIERVRDGFNVARTIGQTVVPLYLDSYGGEVYAANGIVDEMRQFQAEGGVVATHCSTKAMSAANCILANGSRGHRTAAPHATMMFHHANLGLSGSSSAPEFTNEAKELNRLNKLSRAMMAERTNLTDSQWRQMLKNKAGNTSLFMTAAQAQAHGLIDAVGIPVFTVRVGVEFSFAINPAHATPQTTTPAVPPAAPNGGAGDGSSEEEGRSSDESDSDATPRAPRGGNKRLRRSE